MKASELIVKLQEQISQHGNLEVYTCDYELGAVSTDSVEFKPLGPFWPHEEHIYIS